MPHAVRAHSRSTCTRSPQVPRADDVSCHALGAVRTHRPQTRLLAFMLTDNMRVEKDPFRRTQAYADTTRSQTCFHVHGDGSYE